MKIYSLNFLPLQKMISIRRIPRLHRITHYRNLKAYISGKSKSSSSKHSLQQRSDSKDSSIISKQPVSLASQILMKAKSKKLGKQKYSSLTEIRIKQLTQEQENLLHIIRNQADELEMLRKQIKPSSPVKMITEPIFNMNKIKVVDSFNIKLRLNELLVQKLSSSLGSSSLGRSSETYDQMLIERQHNKYQFIIRRFISDAIEQAFIEIQNPAEDQTQNIESADTLQEYNYDFSRKQVRTNNSQS